MDLTIKYGTVWSRRDNYADKTLPYMGILIERAEGDKYCEDLVPNGKLVCKKPGYFLIIRTKLGFVYADSKKYANEPEFDDAIVYYKTEDDLSKDWDISGLKDSMPIAKESVAKLMPRRFYDAYVARTDEYIDKLTEMVVGMERPIAIVPPSPGEPLFDLGL